MNTIQTGGGDGDLPKSTRTSTPPIAGRIYFLRITIEKAFGLKPSRSAASGSSTSSSSTTFSTTRGKKTKKRNSPNKRPGLVLYVENESFSVLVCSGLHGIDPRVNDPTQAILLPEFSREEVLTHLLSIHPAPPLVDGRRSIMITKPDNSTYFTSEKKNYYVALKIIQLPIETRCKRPINAYFERDELLYIHEGSSKVNSKVRKLQIWS